MKLAVGEQTSLAERKQRAGQRLIIGFSGANPSADLVRFCRDVGPAGFVVYGHNIEEPAQVVELNRELSGLVDSHTPALITVDQEGGIVSRIRETSWPSARALGERDQPDMTFDVARALGTELAALGFDVNWAPVADIGMGGGSHGERSFSDDRDIVARHVAAFIRGLHAAGITACAKHFPGLGDSGTDPHEDLGVVDKDQGDLVHHELVPFQAAIAAGVGVVMTGHVRVPVWDEAHPASLSPVVVRQWLRHELGFGGVVVSDDLQMKAVLGRCPLEEQLDHACMGTTDLFIVGSSLDAAVAVWETLVRLQERDAFPGAKSQHDDLATDSFKRLMALRRRLLIGRGRRPDPSVVGSLDHKTLAAMVTA